MNFCGVLSDISEVSEMKELEKFDISSGANEKFDKLMGDNNLREEKTDQRDNRTKLNPEERENKFKKLFDLREPNYIYEFNGNIYETDDNGQTYSKNGEILPNIEYTVNGNNYKTDANGNKVSCDSNPKYTEEGSRNMKEQKESGGEERREDDDGGHIIARILGGAEGEENLVPMRRTINRGDYKKMENEIAKALQEGKKVTMHIDLEYNSDSHRPSKIRAEYIIEGKKTVVEFDNDENSTELIDSLGYKISDEDYNNLKEEIEDMKADGIEASVTSVKVENDENSNSIKVTVGILDECTGQKSYKVYTPR